MSNNKWTYFVSHLFWDNILQYMYDTFHSYEVLAFSLIIYKLLDVKTVEQS